MTYQSWQWFGQYVIAPRPDVLGVCHIEAEDSTEKLTMVCDDEDLTLPYIAFMVGGLSQAAVLRYLSIE